jgi:hypothetical protein
VDRTLEQAVVEFLSFSQTGTHHETELAGFSIAQWERCLAWMDNSGLALYFLRAVENHSDWIPLFVLERLQTKHQANLDRTAYMERQFILINRAFETAGLKYVAVKGSTLVPEFCPDAALRHQSDLDYLVNRPSLQLSRKVLEHLGYVLHTESRHELSMVLPCYDKPARGDEQYKPMSPHSVELHLAIMPKSSHVAWEEPPFLENAIVRLAQGSAFCGLNEEDTLLLQSIHAFCHILAGWMKLSWLYEIGFFLNTREEGSNLWQTLSERLVLQPVLREAVAVVVGLASQFFGAHIPFAINKWTDEVRPAVRIWIDNYARPWAFGPNLLDEDAWFPTSKLVLFLHQQYVADSTDWRRILASRLLGLGGIDRIKRRMAQRSSPVRRLMTLVTARDFRRVGYHVGANLRYFWELPRWRYLTRGCRPTVSNSTSPTCSAATQKT